MPVYMDLLLYTQFSYALIWYVSIYNIKMPHKKNNLPELTQDDSFECTKSRQEDYKVEDRLKRRVRRYQRYSIK